MRKGGDAAMLLRIADCGLRIAYFPETRLAFLPLPWGEGVHVGRAKENLRETRRFANIAQQRRIGAKQDHLTAKIPKTLNRGLRPAAHARMGAGLRRLRGTGKIKSKKRGKC